MPLDFFRFDMRTFTLLVFIQKGAWTKAGSHVLQNVSGIVHHVEWTLNGDQTDSIPQTKIELSVRERMLDISWN